MVSHIPDELIFEILSWLPSKSLMRCQAVCKSWSSLISSAHFKVTHRQNFNQLNPRHLFRCFESLRKKEVYSVHLDDEALTVDPEVLIEFPFSCNCCFNTYFRVIGCCNGIVCLSHDRCVSREDKLILWNPSIKRNLTLTQMFRSRHVKFMYFVYGFGYDKVIEDHKVVRLAYNSRSFSTPKVEVYTVESGVSKVVMFPNDLPYYSMYLDGWSQVFLNGSVHWIICDFVIGASNSSILTFDMSREVFGEIQLPKNLVNKSPMLLEVTSIGEYLAMIYSRRYITESSGASTYMVSAMREYKNPASWTLLYKVDHPDRDMGRVLRLRNNGEIIMGSEYGELQLFDYNFGYYVANNTGFIIERSIHIDTYQESLALLGLGNWV